jgi:hypothetical protein
MPGAHRQYIVESERLVRRKNGEQHDAIPRPN